MSTRNPAATTSRPTITTVILTPEDNPPPVDGPLNPGGAPALLLIAVVEVLEEVDDDVVEMLDELGTL